MINHGRTPFSVVLGMRVARRAPVDDLEPTPRDTGGFGSSEAVP